MTILDRVIRQSLCLTILFVLSAAPNASGVAFRLPNQDPEAISRGNAFVATADNPSAIYYNPAGITQLEGHNLGMGLYMVSAGTEFLSTNGMTAKTDTAFQGVPQIYYVYSPPNSSLSYGVGIYAPYGLSLDYGPSNPIHMIAEYGKLLYASVNPVVAWQVHPTLSLGIGPTINYSIVEFKRGIPGGLFKFDGDGYDVGFNAGLLWQPHDKWSFGLSYRYLTTVNFEGESEFTPIPATSTSAELRFPQYAIFGVSFRPSEKWNIEIDIDWTDWDNVNEIAFLGTAAGRQVLPLNYTSGFMYGIGVTRRLPHGYWLNAGYFFSENSSPDQFYNPIVPDGDLHLPGLGVGRRGERWDWAFGFHFGYNGGGREVRNSVFGADGTAKTFNPALNLSATYKF